MNIRIIFFIFLALFILLGSHFLVYYSLIRFFQIASQQTRFILLALFFFLSVSFFLASALAHFQESAFSIAFYSAASFWLGLLTNLFLVSILLWIFYPIIVRRNMPLVAGTVFGLALLFSAYGVWNAFHPRVKNVEVKIKNLPAAWRGKNVVQISDVHLGHVYGASFARDLTEKINALDPDIVFITGDLFDGMDGNLLDFVNPLGEIKSKKGLFFVTGNHETYLGVEKTLKLLQQTKIKVLNDQVANIDGLQIVGYSYPPRQDLGGDTKNFSATVQKMTGFVQGVPTILLHHAPIDIEAAKSFGVNLQLSGHTHLGQLFPFNMVTHLIYKGYDYGLKTEGDYSIYTTNGIGTWGPPMRTLNTPEIVVITLR